MFNFLSGEKRSESPKTAAEAAMSYFGSFVSSVQDITTVIKTQVERVADTALSDFSKEQNAFVCQKNKHGCEPALPPWTGCSDESKLKDQIIALSVDKRNFLRDPPPGARQFNFDFETFYPVAMVTLLEDPKLEVMRFELVPKEISEEHFWRNYFYRVSLIKQSSAALSSNDAKPPAGVTSSQSSPSPIPVNADVRSSSTWSGGLPVVGAILSPASPVTSVLEDSDLESEASFAGEPSELSDAPTIPWKPSVSPVGNSSTPTDITVTPRAEHVTVAIVSTTDKVDDATTPEWEVALQKELNSIENLDDLEASLSMDMANLSNLTAQEGQDWEKEIQGMLDDADM